MMLITNQLNGWMTRVAAKMADQQNDLQGAQKIQGNNMVEQFRYIADLVKEQIKTQGISRVPGGNEDDFESIRGHDFMNDFANEDYVTKNIRVMPMGGSSTYEGQSEHTSKHHNAMGSAMRGGEDSEYEEVKMNSEITMELRDTRKLVKERQEEETRKQRELAEKLAKKNKK